MITDIIGQHEVLLPIYYNYNQNSDSLTFFEIKTQDILSCLLEVTINTLLIAFARWHVLSNYLGMI